MKINFKELMDVNEYIKENQLKPSFIEKSGGASFDNINDITYLVIYDDNTYQSFEYAYMAVREARITNSTLVICKGEIKNESKIKVV